MTTAATTMMAGPIATMAVPSTSPLAPVTLGAMSGVGGAGLGIALLSVAAMLLVVRLVATRRGTGSARNRVAAELHLAA